MAAPLPSLLSKQKSSIATDPTRTSRRVGPPVVGVTGAIGGTPLVRLDKLLDRTDLEIYAKLESANPGGSAKDRPAAEMLGLAIASGQVSERTLVVESSSGNMGIGLAQICRYHGLRFRCVVDPRIQPHNAALLAAYGAEIEMVEHPDPGTGDWLTARIERVQEILASQADAYWPNQYANPANPRSHELGTIREIDEALEGTLDLVFVATSSTGTAGGCADYLKRMDRSTRVVAVDAFGSALFGGQPSRRLIPGLGAGLVPPLATGRRFDRLERVSDVDCVVGCRRLVEREAILAGGSSGGVVQALRRLSSELQPSTRAVMILADSGTRYLDTVYDNAWVAANLSLGTAELDRLVRGPDTEVDDAMPEAG